MSSPADPGTGSASAKDVDRRKSLGKYVKRMSSVFKREKSSKSVSTLTSDPVAPSSSTPAPKPEPEKETTTAAPTSTTTSPPALPPTEAKPAESGTTPARATAPPVPITQELNRALLQQERAKALFAKYGLTLESHEWISATSQPISVQRIERPIRMRVHRSCHHCGTSYGPNKVCIKCEHKRCKKCPRYPKKKDPLEKGKQPEAHETPKKKKKKLLTISGKNGEERVYRTPQQRVRRSCHRCQTFFIPANATVCDNCQHVRCTQCPREPAKLNKWPNGYPGDADPESDTDIERPERPDRPLEARRIWRKPRTRVRWECEECHSQFIEGSHRCPGCGHERCDKCTRKPLRRAKNEQQFDPEVIRAVEEKLRALAMDDEPPTSGTEAN